MKTFARPFALLITYDNGTTHRCDISSKREKILALYDLVSVAARNATEAQREAVVKTWPAVNQYVVTRTVSIAFQVRDQTTGEWVTEKSKTV